MEEAKIIKNDKFDTAIEIFETLNTHYPLITGAKVIGKRYNEDGKLIQLWAKVIFSKVNLQKFEPRIHSNLYSLSYESGVSTKLNDLPDNEPSDINVVVISEKKGNKVIIRKEKSNDKQMYLEHWDTDGLSISIKLKDFTKIHNNSVFGTISWSMNADKIVFTAERQDISDYTPYWINEDQKKDEEKSKNEKDKEKKTPHAFDKYKYNNKNSNHMSSYGEMLSDWKYSVIVVYDLIKK